MQRLFFTSTFFIFVSIGLHAQSGSISLSSSSFNSKAIKRLEKVNSVRLVTMSNEFVDSRIKENESLKLETLGGLKQHDFLVKAPYENKHKRVSVRNSRKTGIKNDSKSNKDSK